jgi:signal transduction histidine kinase
MSFASHVPRSPRDYRRIIAGSVAVAALVFAIDLIGRQIFAVGIGYVIVILLVARAQRKSWVVITAGGCSALAALAYLGAHGFEPPREPLVRSLVGFGAIVSSAIFAWKSLTASGDPTANDNTARNEAQAALQATQLDLAHATRLTALGELTASIAHEVNQPLAAILSNAQASLRWLRRPEPQLDEAIRSLDAIVAETRRAGSVIQGIRALARKQAPQVERFDLGDLVHETLALLRSELKRSGTTLGSEIDASAILVEADRIQIQQVIINLVMNGIQAMIDTPADERRLRVACRRDDDKALVAVSDHGPGIAPDVMANLFTAFVTTKAYGMGLGLSVCASIVGRHGGRIWADDDVLQGASVRFSLPLANPEIAS